MDDIERAFLEAHGQAVATLIRIFGDITLAEDAVQDAFVAALDRWPAAGVPDNPAGWIVTTARNRAADLVSQLVVGQRRRLLPTAGLGPCPLGGDLFGELASASAAPESTTRSGRPPSTPAGPTPSSPSCRST